MKDKFFFVLHRSKPLCLMCSQTNFSFMWSNFERHLQTTHPKFNETYPPGSNSAQCLYVSLCYSVYTRLHVIMRLDNNNIQLLLTYRPVALTLTTHCFQKSCRPQLWQWRFTLYSRLTFIKTSMLLPDKSLYITYTMLVYVIFVFWAKSLVFSQPLTALNLQKLLFYFEIVLPDVRFAPLKRITARDIMTQGVCCRLSQQTEKQTGTAQNESKSIS